VGRRILSLPSLASLPLPRTTPLTTPTPSTPAGDDLGDGLVEELPRRFRVLFHLGQRIVVPLVLAVFLVEAVGVVFLARAVAVKHRFGIDGL